MIDIKELRRLVQAALSKMNARDPEFASSVTPLAVLELLDRLEAAESECLEQARLNGMGASREAALLAKLEAAEENRSHFLVKIGKLYAQCDALRAKIEAMERQAPVAWTTKLALEHRESALGFRVSSVNIWGEKGVPLYALPGAQAQPASSIPVEAIGKMLADVMAVAVSNGANSVSMPDEYVEVAVWLQGECPTQPAPSVPEGWQLVPIEPTQEMLDATSWPNCAGTDYKKMLAAAPRSEAKP